MTKLRYISFFLFLCLLLAVFSASVYPQDSTDSILRPIEKKIVEYEGSDFRDPFDPQVFVEKPQSDIKIQQRGTKSKVKVSELFSLTLQGIIWKAEVPMAIINNKVYKKGEVMKLKKHRGTTFEEVKIFDIDKDGVTVIYAGEMETLPSPASLGVVKGGRDEKNMY